jgi:transposase
LPATARVVSCYEAGRDGFWIDRALGGLGVANRVIDSASIEVNRRARRTKTDRIDARKLVLLLIRVVLGDRTAWREVRVPTPAEEAARQVSRERSDLVAERTRLLNQMGSWLTAVGTKQPKRQGGAWWTTVRDWAGAVIAPELQDRLARAAARLAVVTEQIAELEAQQRRAVQRASAASAAPRLVQLKGVGVTSASTLLDEGLVWREFRNRRQVGGLLGFAPTCYASGDDQRETGISHAGNRRLQAVAIQLAWSWVRWQRQSALTRWFLTRFGATRRARRIGIVAVARKLVIALWRYATAGVLPDGAVLSPR